MFELKNNNNYNNNHTITLPSTEAKQIEMLQVA